MSLVELINHNNRSAPASKAGVAAGETDARQTLARLSALLGDDDPENAVRTLLAAKEDAEVQVEELRRTRDELEISRERYIELFDRAPLGYMTLDDHGMIEAANQEACRMLGYDHHQVVGRALRSFVTWSDRGVLARHMQWCRAGRPDAVTQVRLLRREGPAPVVQLLTPHQTAEPDLRRTILFDLTDQQQVEKLARETNLFREMAGSIDEVFWLMHWPSGQVVYVSPAYERVWGRSAAELYRNYQAWLEAIHPEDRPGIEAGLIDRIAAGPVEQEYRLLREGEVRWIHARSTPVRNASGEVYRIAGVAADITDRKQAEQSLKQQEQALAHLGRIGLMGEMASGISHELNQPLAAIQTYIQGSLMRLRAENEGLGGAKAERRGGERQAAGAAAAGDEEEDEAQDWLVEALEKVNSQSERAGRIIQQLREFARLGEPARQRLAVNDLVREVVKLTRVEVYDQGAEMHLDLADDLPAILAGRVEIEQVLANLVTNAIQAMSEAGSDPRRLTLRTRRAGADSLTLTVADTGPGLPEEQMARIFEPFYTNKPQGMGMGLNICETIVQHHRGRLEVEHNDAGGLSFHLTLPAEQHSDAAGEPAPPRPES